jgi:hypothetical protein
MKSVELSISASSHRSWVHSSLYYYSYLLLSTINKSIQHHSSLFWNYLVILQIDINPVHHAPLDQTVAISSIHYQIKIND